MFDKIGLLSRKLMQKEVEVEGGTVLIRELTAGEAASLGKLTKAGREDEVAITLLRYGCLTPDGLPMFGANDRAEIEGLPLAVFATLSQEIEALSKPEKKV